MKCPYPVVIKHEKLGKYIEVPCGKCIICQRNLVADWAFRLRYEAESSKSVFFVRLSYDNEHLPTNNGYPTLQIADLQKFFKKLRKTGLQFRYFAVGEYGGQFGRPHYHVLFFLPKKMEWLPMRNLIYEKWFNQNIHVQSARDLVRLAHYTGKYCFKNDNRISKEYQERPFRTMSRKPILGYRYLEKFGKEHLKKTDYRFLSFESKPDKPIRLPLAFQRKIFTNENEITKLNRLLLNAKEKPQKHEITSYFKVGETRLRVSDPCVGAYLHQRRVGYAEIEQERERIRKSLTDTDL